MGKDAVCLLSHKTLAYVSAASHKATLAAAVGILSIGTSAQAQIRTGSFCPVAHVRVDGSPDTALRGKLWEYTGERAPAHPVFGWVDLVCWTTIDAVPFDIAKRTWFGISRRGGPPSTESILEFSDPQLMSGVSGVGITHEGMSMYYEVLPGHDCVFDVHVWGESCVGGR